MTRRLRLVLARVDVRLALRLAGLTAAFTSALLCGLLAYAVKESLEEQAAAADAVLAAIDADPTAGAAAARHASAAYRIHDAASVVIASGGAWPPTDRVRRDLTTLVALGARASDFLVREGPRRAGGTVAAAMPLAHFARERGELVDRTVAVILLGLIGSIVLGVVSARRALQPLRDTTAAIRAIDPRKLAARVPMRGTGDDVDALAAATNEVLARLAWAFDRLAAFSADAAHELRTPVNRILNTAEVALTTTTDVDAKDDALVGVRDAAEAMRRSIDLLLLLARGEDGGLPLLHRAVDLGELVAGLGELYGPEAERLDKHLVVASDNAVVSADRDLVERAAANLVENALGHSVPGATIRIGVERRNGTAAVVVEDSGPGVAPADHDRIFDRFVRLGTRGNDGAGLGLPIVRMVARVHGGECTVEASALGGAAFRLRLPMARSPATD